MTKSLARDKIVQLLFLMNQEFREGRHELAPIRINAPPKYGAVDPDYEHDSEDEYQCQDDRRSVEKK